jgi:dUTP pyrophosphatase
MFEITALKFTKLSPDAVTPAYGKLGDAGLDLVAISVSSKDEYIEYDTGLAFEVLPGYVGLLFPRSSVSNYQLILANAVGVIDSNYRGSVKARFRRTPQTTPNNVYKVGDKVVQLVIVPIPYVELMEVAFLSPTDRGTQGFGSSGA